MHDVIVVGSGLFGSIISRHLRCLGMDVHVVDDRRPNAGSAPAACLMKPSWLSSLTKEQISASMSVLDRLYRISTLNFEVQALRGKVTSSDVFWVDPRDVFNNVLDRNACVRRVDAGTVVTENGFILEARHIIVAAGIWTQSLLPSIKQRGLVGAACLWRGGHIGQPFIRPWAPFKQIVAFNRGDGLWVGDGSAIKLENWTDERQALTVDRCASAVLGQVKGLPDNSLRVMRGIRPYAKGRPYILEETSPGVWAASGGAKNGTAAAGYVAHELGERLS